MLKGFLDAVNGDIHALFAVPDFRGRLFHTLRVRERPVRKANLEFNLFQNVLESLLIGAVSDGGLQKLKQVSAPRNRTNFKQAFVKPPGGGFLPAHDDFSLAALIPPA